MVVGECGMNPDYFFREMGPAETNDFVKGYSRRQRSGWEQARLLADVVCKVLGGEGTGITFPWEKDEKEAGHREDEMKRVNALREYAKEIEKRMEEKR